jgi:hypothetical protein
MKPAPFPEATHGLVQCSTGEPAPSCVKLGQTVGGSMDGALYAIVCHEPTEAERIAIAGGAKIFVKFLGTMPAHIVCLSLEEAEKS